MKSNFMIRDLITVFNSFRDASAYFFWHLIKIWYNIYACVEDRATLGSDPSANAGGYTEAVHFARPFYIIYYNASGSHKSDKSQGVWGTASLNTIKKLIPYYLKSYCNLNLLNHNIFHMVYNNNLFIFNCKF